MHDTQHEAPRLYPSMVCRDPDAMIDWLVRVLGFRLRVAYRREGVVAHAELGLDGSILMLGQAREGQPDGKGGSLYLAVDDADATHAAVLAAGGTIDRPLTTTDYGSRDFAFRDPEGNVWNVGTYRPRMGEAPLPG